MTQVVDLGFNKRDVFVYWRQIRTEARNGPDFAYVVTQVLTSPVGSAKISHQVSPLEPDLTTDAYALFKDIPK